MTREQIYGRRPVREALRGPREVLELWVTERALKAEPWLREARPGARHQVKPERDLTEAAGTRDDVWVAAARRDALPPVESGGASGEAPPRDRFDPSIVEKRPVDEERGTRHARHHSGQPGRGWSAALRCQAAACGRTRCAIGPR